MLRLGVNPVPWPCCSGRLLLLWHRWEQLLGSGQSRESQHFHVSALTLRMESWLGNRKWEIFVSKVTATIEEETRGKPSFMYPDESRTHLTDSPAKGKCPNPVLQYSVLTFNFVHRSYRFSQPTSKPLPVEENSHLSIPCRWTMFTTGSRSSFPISMLRVI